MRWHRFPLLLILLATVVGCDHTSKHLARVHLDQQDAISVVPGVLDLRLVKNTDTGFSLLSRFLTEPARLTVILTLVTAVTLGMILVFARRWRHASIGERAAFVLLLGGALGNLLDRYARGYVIDFIHVRHWPVFNVADIALCAGAALFLLTAARTRSRAPG